MTAGSRPGETARWDVIACALIFGTALLIYALTLAPSVLPGDGGELIAASRTLSVAHPPGYPLYLMLGKLFSSVFVVGSMAYRYNLMSAVLASAVSVMAFLLVRLAGGGRWAGAAAALGLATREAWWLQATGAEVYTLNAAFVALLLLVALTGGRRGDKAYVPLGLLGGLAISHHLSLVYAFAAAVIGLLVGLRIKPRPRVVVAGALLFLLGLSVWLYIPIRSAQSPPLTWGDTATLKGFISHVTAQGYRWRLRPFALGARLGDLGAYARLILAQSGPWLSALAVLGFAVSLRRRRFAPAFVLVLVFYGIHSAAYNIPDIGSHVFPALLAVGVAAGLGANFLAEKLGGLQKGARPAVLVAVSVISIANIISLDRRQDEWFAHDYAAAALESAGAPGGAAPLLVGGGSGLDYPALYLTLVEGADVEFFVLGMSDPMSAGLPRSPLNVDECVEWALETRDAAEVALVGPVPEVVAGHETRICGMVYTLSAAGGDCEPPERYEVRGHDGDGRDFNSRLLSGTYHLHNARYYLSIGDTASARAYVYRAVAAAFDEVGTHIYASRLFLELGSPPESFRMAERAVEIDPDCFGAHDMLASLYYMGGSIDRAVAEYEKALVGSPNQAPVYSNLGNAYIRKRDFTSAMHYYRRALSLDNSMVQAHVGLGIALSHTGDAEGGLRHFGIAKDLQPHSPIPYHSEASVLMGMDRYDEALATIRSGLGAVPGDASLLSDMGLAFLRTDAPDSAVHYLELALDADPHLLTARGNLGVAYERVGDNARAAEQYRKYLETAPPDASRDRAAAALRRLTE
jgi:tetratricopeptide (TPR) repeat protein